MLKYTAFKAPFGSVGIVVSAQGLRELTMSAGAPGETARRLAQRHVGAVHDRELMPSLQQQLQDYLAGERVRFRARVDLVGLTDFQRRVLEACAKVDYAQTITYGELARRIGKPLASRAVGAALGRNPVPLVIPCHRIVGCNGALGGFSAEQGVAVKRWLLDLESSVTPALTSCCTA